MRILLIVSMLSLAVPAAAQQAKICNGKEAFQLSDGTSGCLLESRKAHFTQSVSIDGIPNRSKEVPSVLLHVALFGEFSTKWRDTTPRHRETCKALQSHIQATFGGQKYRNVITHLHWPGVEVPEHAGDSGDFAHQSAYMTKNCRTVKYFGTRTN